MALRRYNRTPRIMGGKVFGTARAATAIRFGVEEGTIPVRRMKLKEKQRLDVVAGEVYGNATLWWVIAAASGIGWGLQAPPGTVLFIPTSLSDISRIVG